jgi:hypothetical protein
MSSNILQHNNIAQAQFNHNLKNAVFWDVMPCGFIRTNVLEECITSIFGVEGISELGTMLAATSSLIEECHLMGCYAMWLL